VVQEKQQRKIETNGIHRTCFEFMRKGNFMRALKVVKLSGDEARGAVS
jgi:hypothetical protein